MAEVQSMMPLSPVFGLSAAICFGSYSFSDRMTSDKSISVILINLGRHLINNVISYCIVGFIYGS